MKAGLAKTIIYGCLSLWVIAGIAAGVTAENELAIQQVGTILCPDDTTPDHTTYQQTVTDSSGHTTQDTAWILQCKDASGTVVEEDSAYWLPWLGIFVGATMLLTLPILVVVLIALLVNRGKGTKPGVQGKLP